MAEKPEKPASNRVVSSQTLSSMVDEGLFSIYKVMEAVGLGTAFKRNTWNIGIGALKEILKGLFSLKVLGRENIPAAGAAIICVRSSTDAYPFFACVSVSESGKRALHQAFDIEFFKILGLRSALNWLDSIEIADGKVSGPEKDRIKKYIADNELVGLSIENVKRVEDAEEVVPAIDTIEIARDCGVPIIPVQVSNGDGVFDLKTRKVSLNKNISIQILPAYTRHLDKNFSVKDCIAELKGMIIPQE